MTPKEFIQLDLKTIKEFLDNSFKPAGDIKEAVRRIVPRSFYSKSEGWPKIYKGLMICIERSIIYLQYLDLLVEFKINEKEGAVSFLEKYRIYGNDEWFEYIDSY